MKIWEQVCNVRTCYTTSNTTAHQFSSILWMKLCATHAEGKQVPAKLMQHWHFAATQPTHAAGICTSLCPLMEVRCKLHAYMATMLLLMQGSGSSLMCSR
jgi:hypothetical protein